MLVRRSLFTAMFFLSSLSGGAWAQSPKPATLPDLAKYTGADRGRVLYDGAKKEGKFLWYTSLIANKELMVLRDSQLLLPYTSPYLSEYPEPAKQKAPGGLVLWTADRESYIGVGYNKNILPAADIPKNFDGLLKPALKGKMATSNDDVAARLVGGMIKSKGEAFVRKLKDQDVVVHGLNGPGFNELIVSGEVPISFTAIHSNIGHAVDKGASVAWAPMDLVPAISGGIALFSHAQHPYGALLLIDFFLSPEGQKMLIETFKHGSPLKDYGFKRWYPEEGFTTSQYDEAMNRWQKLVSEFARR